MSHCAGVSENVAIVLGGNALGGIDLGSILTRLCPGMVRLGTILGFVGRVVRIFPVIYSLYAVVIANRLLLRAEVA